MLNRLMIKVKNPKRLILWILCAAVGLLPACAGGGKTPPDVPAASVQEPSPSAEPNVPSPSAGLPKIRFGASQDILLLDIEWHTYESFAETVELSAGDEWLTFLLEQVRDGELYVSKSVNGNEMAFFTSRNPYNDTDDPSQIDPDGHYIFHIYPFIHSVSYQDENGEAQIRYFVDDSILALYNEKEFYCFKPDFDAFCAGLLERGLIDREYYDSLIIESPLEYCVREMGLFDKEDLINYPPAEYSFPPAPAPIKDKNSFSMLFVGNSLTYSGDVPGQLATLAVAHGVTVEYDEICPSGSRLSQTKDGAIELMRNKSYDYVVFQDYGGRPSSDERDAFMSDIEILAEEAGKSGAIPVLYNPAWANVESKPDADNQPHFTSPIARAAKLNGAILVNAADAFVYAYDKHPGLSLYLPNNDYHANDAGAYLTACVFAATLFDLQITEINEENIYSGEDAIRLGQAAWEFVSNS